MGKGLAVSGWHVAYVKHEKEFAIARDLYEAGYMRASFVPERRLLRTPRHIRHGRAEPIQVIVPLYPRYIFVRAGNDNMLSFLLRHKAVVGIVREGRDYINVRDRVIRHIRAIVKEGVYDDPTLHVESKKTFEIGDNIEVTEGAFSGYSGVYLSPKGRKAYVVLSSGGRELPVELPFDLLSHR